MGHGSFGYAYKVYDPEMKWGPNHQFYVMKEINLAGRSELERAQILEDAGHEVKIMQQLIHPNIIKFFEVRKNADKVGISMELADDGTIEDKIRDRVRRHERDEVEYFSERQVMFWFVQTMMAVAYMHDPERGRMIHRDIKPENVFLMKNGMVKLADFGTAKKTPKNSLAAT